MVAGLPQVPPSMNVTLPSVTAIAALVTVAVNVTSCPGVDGFGDDTSVVFVSVVLPTAKSPKLVNPLPVVLCAAGVEPPGGVVHVNAYFLMAKNEGLAAGS